MSAAAISVNHLSVTLGGVFKAVDDVSFELPAGRIAGLIGPSGAGKTTLIRALVGRQKISHGTAGILGQPAGSSGLRHQVSYMTQTASVYPDLSVRENLVYFATMFGLARRELGPGVDAIIETVGLTAQAGRLVQKLSGGQRQRVSLAVALIGTPRLMVLDEPTVGLDPVLREDLWKLFRRLADGGATIIVSSHAMDEAERCDELLLLRDGRVLAQGTPRELCRRNGAKTVEQTFLKLVGEAS